MKHSKKILSIVLCMALITTCFLTGTVSANGAVNGTQLTSSSVMLGDVNQDGVVSLKDASSLQRYLASAITLTSAGLQAADVNSSGTVDLKDATLIQEYLAKIISSFPTSPTKRVKAGMSAKEGVFYEIFVRSFADSNGDGIGDFNGITAKLDYLKTLGIDGIWLTPINPSPSYHGYDVTDYTTVNSQFGTMADFQNLLNEAHKRGIKIIMDFVVNHTSNQNPWFKKSASGDAKYKNYYEWATPGDGTYNSNDRSPWGSSEWQGYGNNKYYFAMFGGGMPDLNYEDPDVRTDIISAATGWLKMGVDGFRLDAALHVYGQNEHKNISNPLQANLDWWNEFGLACEAVNPNVYIVGETWDSSDTTPYSQPFDSKFNFEFESALMSGVINKNATAVLPSYEQNGGSTVSLASYLQILQKNDETAAGGNYLDGVFGTNHDMSRIMSQLNGNVDQAKLVANVYMTLTGNPYIYYGEELGMYGPKPDERIREPFLWTSNHSGLDTTWESTSSNSGKTAPLSQQISDPNSMYSYYKNLISIRKSNPPLLNGNYTALNVNNNNVMAYTRSAGGVTDTVIHNFSSQAVTISLTSVQGGTVIFKTNNNTTLSGSTVTLDKYSSIIIKN
ncbi:MAG: alpha-amylase family glycosyl hydrolase [Bacillota bacterium]|nr:alpha-amylase family glycosyl hydrolase [Bacillota bacterium]